MRRAQGTGETRCTAERTTGQWLHPCREWGGRCVGLQVPPQCPFVLPRNHSGVQHALQVTAMRITETSPSTISLITLADALRLQLLTRQCSVQIQQLNFPMVLIQKGFSTALLAPHILRPAPHPSLPSSPSPA